jgi:23S rRNA (guanosine2251-2'-O)-methyltransferase
VRSRPQDLTAVYYDAGADRRLAAILETARAAGIPVHPYDERSLTALAGSGRHQGLVATAHPFPYAAFERVMVGRARLLILADQMQDPQNLGALLRTAAAVGAGAVIIPKDGAAAVTPAVEAAAAGAAALVPVCRVTNAVRSLRELKDLGCWTAGLFPKGGANLYTTTLPERLAVVIGGEAGMRPLVARECDFALTIPMKGHIESLNASVAAAVVLYEIVRRWSFSAPEMGSVNPGNF